MMIEKGGDKMKKGHDDIERGGKKEMLYDNRKR